MLSIKVTKVIPLDHLRLLVFFENDVNKIFDVAALMEECPEFEILRDPALFQLVKVEPGGYGISWTDELDCSEGELWENGVEIPLTAADFARYANYEMMHKKKASWRNPPESSGYFAAPSSSASSSCRPMTLRLSMKLQL